MTSMNRTFVVMVFSTVLLYAGTLILFDVSKCLPSTFNPITNNPIFHTLLCNR